jgi:glycerophosphoryl diester phosphodiesterase
VTLSADGVPVVIHDDTLARTSNAAEVFPQRAPWPVNDFTLAELKMLDFGTWFTLTDPFQQINAGAVTQEELVSYLGERIPTLEEALRYTLDKRWRVNVEIKDMGALPGAETLVSKVIALIARLDMAERVLVSSFNHDYLRECKRVMPALATAALVEHPLDDPIPLLRELGASAYHPPVDVALESVRAVRAAGFDVNVWTVNDELSMRALIDAGAAGIITDFPQSLNGILEE